MSEKTKLELLIGKCLSCNLGFSLLEIYPNEIRGSVHITVLQMTRGGRFPLTMTAVTACGNSYMQNMGSPLSPANALFISTGLTVIHAVESLVLSFCRREIEA